eukprot:jgi/Galph1/4553/GphlegSOOS_G3318.1
MSLQAELCLVEDGQMGYTNHRSKRNLEIQKESQTLASISLSNLFLLYPKFCEEAEFNKIYNLEVVVIPTNKTMIRRDYDDLIYKTEYFKWKLYYQKMYKIGRPVLVGTTSVENLSYYQIY